MLSLGGVLCELSSEFSVLFSPLLPLARVTPPMLDFAFGQASLKEPLPAVFM